MIIEIFATKDDMARAAAKKAAEMLRAALAAKDRARFIAATGASQFEFLEHLSAAPGIDWGRTVMFHLDEYVGLPETHPASFRKYLRERLIEKVHPGEVDLIQGDAADPHAESARVGELISQAPVDVAFVGIGENGHLAFNDPPADFDTNAPYIVVDLDEACRGQQVGEGWFSSLDEVPKQAISMSIAQIMKAEHVICTVPDVRKAEAVRDCLGPDAPVSNLHPASILKNHARVFVYLDAQAASLLEEQ
ncbi:MAG TPA: glucosamine-6-phosphate deaminase [Sumerlaeia bacterium]|nr:glucosamine-6-phosphate deaminase [Sumerlaeia bacterium]